MAVRTFSAVIHKEDDLYVAECPEVGTASQGYSIEEALANLKEATELYLEDFSLPDFGHPLITTFEVNDAGRSDGEFVGADLSRPGGGDWPSMRFTPPPRAR